jgi:hypothetical protein
MIYRVVKKNFHTNAIRLLHYMLLGPFNGLQNWQYAQISTVLTPLKRFFAPKKLKSAPKWLKLMPEILKMQIFVTQFNFKVSKFRLTSTNCKQNAPKLN